MTRPVQKNPKSFFTKFLSARIAISAIFKTIAVLCVYSITGSTTATFFTLVLSEMTFAYSCRNLEIPIWKNHNINKHLNISMIILLLIQILFFFTPIGKLIDLNQMNITDIVTSILATIITIILDETTKPLLARINQRTSTKKIK